MHDFIVHMCFQYILSWHILKEQGTFICYLIEELGIPKEIDHKNK